VRVRDDGVPKSAVDFHNQSLRAIGVPVVPSRTEIFLTRGEREAGRKIIADLAGATVKEMRSAAGIHPGATWPAKRWLPERFAGLADRLVERGATVFLTAGVRDEETVAAVQRSAKHPYPVLSGLPLRELAAVIASCDVYVTNDAGPMHIAAAAGTPTIGIFGPGEENIWFPYSREDGHCALRKDVPCHPCHLDFCNRTGTGFMECMKLLSESEVLREVDRVLQRKASRPVR
jgi:ADP-heptose:LPS heptosyltransferase